MKHSVRQNNLILEFTSKLYKTSKSMRTKWRQFHLSTLLLLTLTAGVAIWVNFVAHNDCFNGGEEVYESDVQQELIVYGWPAPAYYRLTGKAWYLDGRKYEQSKTSFPWQESDIGIAIDMIFAFGLLLVVAFSAESLIRRHDKTT